MTSKRELKRREVNREANKQISPPQDKEAKPVDLAPVLSDSLSFETAHVFDVYEKIAEHFSATRYKPWPKVASFIASLAPHALVLDAGCGNGKNLLRPGMIGSDRAHAFCKIASDVTKRDCYVSDISRDTGLAVREGVFDAAISIAVLHHIPSQSGRQAALMQLARLIKRQDGDEEGGKVLIYVWAMEQEEGSIGARKFDSQDVFVPWHYQVRYDEKKHSARSRESGSELEAGNEFGKQTGHLDAIQSAESSASSHQPMQAMQRYYHVFTRTEFAELLASVSDYFTVDDLYFDSNNWATVLKRTSKKVDSS